MRTKEIELDAKTIAIAKMRFLESRQEKVPIEAVVALAAMKTKRHRPHNILNIASEGDAVTLIGQIRQGEVYDPVSKALSYLRDGVDAVSLFTDDRIYSKGMDDLLLVSLGVPNSPVIYQDYILNEYHVTEARAAGAAAIVVYSSILDRRALRQVVSLAQRWQMTSIVQVSDIDELDYATSLSPHVIGFGVDRKFIPERDFAIIEDLASFIPYNMRRMSLGCLQILDEVATAVELGMNAVIVDDALIKRPESAADLNAILGRD
jgi:indole-3-glycerol phosphate synthase